MYAQPTSRKLAFLISAKSSCMLKSAQVGSSLGFSLSGGSFGQTVVASLAVGLSWASGTLATAGCPGLQAPWRQLVVVGFRHPGDSWLSWASGTLATAGCPGLQAPWRQLVVLGFRHPGDSWLSWASGTLATAGCRGLQAPWRQLVVLAAGGLPHLLAWCHLWHGVASGHVWQCSGSCTKFCVSVRVPSSGKVCSSALPCWWLAQPLKWKWGWGCYEDDGEGKYLLGAPTSLPTLVLTGEDGMSPSSLSSSMLYLPPGILLSDFCLDSSFSMIFLCE